MSTQRYPPRQKLPTSNDSYLQQQHHQLQHNGNTYPQAAANEAQFSLEHVEGGLGRINDRVVQNPGDIVTLTAAVKEGDTLLLAAIRGLTENVNLKLIFLTNEMTNEKQKRDVILKNLGVNLGASSSLMRWLAANIDDKACIRLGDALRKDTAELLMSTMSITENENPDNPTDAALYAKMTKLLSKAQTRIFTEEELPIPRPAGQ